VTLEGNKVIISNLKFYQEISFNDSDLTTLRDNIQNLIDENEINSNNISSYLSSQIYDLVKNIDTVNNGSLEQYVVEPTYSSDSINISLKSDVGYYKFKTSSFTNVSITSNQISLNSITLFTPPTPSPVNWFTWDGTQITGLSSLGKNATKLVFPKIATGISDNAFNNNKIITSVDCSYSEIRTFGMSVFSECSNLSSVVLPETLTSLQVNNFYKCSKLERINLPESIKNIYSGAFNGCTQLSSINLPKSLISLRNNVFYECSNLSSVVLPDTLTSIGTQLFYKCAKLSSVTLSKNISIIPDETFRECESLKSISLPTSITTIGVRAFYLSGLTSITLLENVSSLGVSCLEFCYDLVSINMSSSKISTIPIEFAYQCRELKYVNLPNSITRIENYGFASCDSLEEITIPNGITHIEPTAFANNGNGTTDPLPNLVIYVNSNSAENIVKQGFKGIVINLSRG
ncbi:MAG: leucine-rich repeat domain-containing protein, partial [Ureaplasma sp.]|nr:leucine-rich repeat domain-containing protein [Ureaplasma sp.]